MSKTFEQLQKLVVQWANDRKIIENSTPAAQSKKTVEEAAELLEAAVHLYVNEGLQGTLSDYKKELGDVLVTLIVGAGCVGVDVTECMEMAYERIKDRKGTLRADGVFVKDAA
jgi:NTP pyrophosphatase (non-canonical NTP hydrolase)